MTRDWLFFTGEGWTPFSQRGQAFALELAARGERVFFFEPMVSIPKLIHKFIFLRGKETICPPGNAVIVLKPLISFWRFRGSEVSFLDRWAFNLWYRVIKRKYGISIDAILYINMPYWWMNIVTPDVVRHSKLIYDCIDDCRIYSRNQRIQNIMEFSECSVAKKADILLATADVLVEKMKRVGGVVNRLSNGVDMRRFDLRGVSSKQAGVLNDVGGLIFGFVGALYFWIDFDAILLLADSFPDVSIVLVGPRDASFPEIEMRMRKNIIIVGPVPYSEVPDYISRFDVCLNVFNSDKIGDTVNPIKIYEYLAMGKPIVCAKTIETEKFDDMVYLYDSKETLLASAEKAINDDGNIDKRVEYASRNGWDKKVSELLGLVSSSIDRVEC